MSANVESQSGSSLNERQKIVRGAALVLFVLTLVWTPWRYDGLYGSEIAFASLWSPPESATVDNVRLALDIAFVEWLGIYVLYLGLVHLFKGDSAITGGEKYFPHRRT